MSKTGSIRSSIGMASTCVCEKTKFIHKIALCPSGGGGDQGSASSLECELASNITTGMSWLVTSGVWSVLF